MNIGIIGSGHIGGTLARLFAGAGHHIAISNSRGPQSLTNLEEELGPTVRATTTEEAADFGEVVIVAIPYREYRSLPSERLSGKIVVDAMNYYPQRDGEIEFGYGTSTELFAQQLPGARMVKAFNTMNYDPLGSRGDSSAPMDERLALFVASDDADAKTTVSRLIEEIGFAPVDTGSLRNGGRQQQPGSPVYGHTINARDARAVLAAL